ncbi:MAG: MarR family winged helix-turn-helix transcriptional regulator [Longicatena sp.]
MQPLTKSAGRYVSKLSNKIRRRLDTFYSKGNLSGAQGKVLHFILAQEDDIFQKDIEEEYGLRPSSATVLLQQMEKNDIIKRVNVPYDARLKKIVVTPKALAHKEQVIHDLSQLEAEITQGIPQKDLTIFFQVIEKMLKNMSA